MPKSYLVVGGAGFIGANLVRQLLKQEANIRVLDNLSAGRAADLEGLPVELVVGDIRDKPLVDEVVQGSDVVVHLAAHTSVIDSIQEPEVNLEINVQGTFNLLQASVRHGVERFIFASTGGAIIGDVAPPVHEDMAPHPVSPYGASKLAGDGYCSAFYGSYGLKTCSLRFSNIYGPFSYHKGSVVAKFFRQIQGKNDINIFGDGGQTRDFCFVGDLCRAILAAINTDKLPFGQAIQLGTGQATSVNQLVALMRQVVGDDNFPPVHYAPPRQGEVLQNFVSIAKAQIYLGYQPETDLLSGLQITWDWFQQLS